MNVKTHSPQDQIYGPLDIPAYCWPIIDTPEFQRLRYITQLGTVQYVFPGANHTRFEHCLGCAHLAARFMDHFEETQPELNITPEYKQIVIIAALCHDLGHGPYSHLFDQVVKPIDPTWNHEHMSTVILKYIVETYNINISNEVIEAACDAINGYERDGYPSWLFTIVANKDNDVDIDKFDYLSRDMNRTLSISRFEYDRLIVNCRITDGKLSWKLSEITTLERLFFNRNDMHNRVYKHRVAQSIEEMVLDMLVAAGEKINYSELIQDPKVFCQYDDRILYLCELGQCGKEAQKLAMDIKYRRLYKYVGELRIKPGNSEGETYSQQPPSKICDDISDANKALGKGVLRIIPMKFRYGINRGKHPLLGIPFWKPGCNNTIHLSQEDISCIVPQYFAETAMRVFVTDPKLLPEARVAYEKWIQTSIFF